MATPFDLLMEGVFSVALLATFLLGVIGVARGWRLQIASDTGDDEAR